MRPGARSLRASGTLILTVLAWLALTAPPAVAEQVRLFTGSFGATTSTTPASEQDALAKPWSVAVDNSTGPSARDVYVTDGNNHRVEKFGPSGNFILMFGKEVNETAVLESRPEAEQDVCPAPGHPGDECKKGVAGSDPGAFGSRALSVAVDSSSGVSSGDVYVADSSSEPGGDDKVSKFDEQGHLISSWGTAGQLDGSGITSPPEPLVPGPFGKLNGIAVDPAGNLWVYGTTIVGLGAVFEFAQDGSFANNDWSTGIGRGINGFAVGTGEEVYLESGGSTFKYDFAGAQVGLVTEAGVRTEGVAIDRSTDDLYVDANFSSKEPEIQRYDAACHPAHIDGCTPAETFSPEHLTDGDPRALAVDPSTHADVLYVAKKEGGEVAAFSVETVPDVITARASGFTPTAATLNGSVNPAGVPLTECFFEWGESTEYGHKAPCEAPDAAEVGSGSEPVAVHAQIPVQPGHTSVQPGHTYHFRLVAANANDVNELIHLEEPSRGQDVSFGPPRIDSSSITKVDATSATFLAEVSPQNVAAEYRFEYLTEAASLENVEEGKPPFAGALQAPPTDSPLGSGEADVAVSQHVQGLLPHTVYLYRVLAHSDLGTTQGEGRAFTTQTPGPFALPDARAWELVSPPDKHGASILQLFNAEVTTQAAADGRALTYLTTAPIEAEPQGNANFSQVLSARGSGGWESRELAISHAEAIGYTEHTEYPYFSADLSLGILQPLRAFNPSLSAEASEQTAYLRADFAAGQPTQPCGESCIRPLVSAANTPEGTKFGTCEGEACKSLTGQCPPEFRCGPQFRDATPDLSHVVVKSRASLTEGAPANSLYEWSGGQLSFVGKGKVGYEAGSGEVTARHAISDDGSRVFWSDGSGQLFVREDGESTVEIPDPGTFLAASRDGSKVLLSSGKLYDLETKTTTEIPGLEVFLGASEDLSSVYFVSSAVLAPGAQPGTCGGGNSPPGATCNLYLYHDGTTKLVELLSAEDFPDWNGSQPNHEFGDKIQHQSSRVSPDGRWLAFMSQQGLTGYDNRDETSGRRDEEVFLYDSSRPVSEGTPGVPDNPACASCDPTGARPHGVEYEKIETPQLAGGGKMWPDNRWLAANIPGWTTTLYQSRYLSDGGRLFFDSSDALVAQDSNRTEDVYQYEPPGGEGAPPGDGCTSGSPTYSPASGGCVDLISSGTSEEESAFLDASQSGEDVFFLTYARLSLSHDVDAALDVYDAHVCSAASPCLPAPESGQPACEGDACQSPAGAPEDLTPGSLIFQGPGNLTPLVAKPGAKPLTRAQKLANALRACNKKPKKKRASCKRQARRRYGAAKAKKSPGTRRRKK
jgi:hypothetical protein